jgi:hypothetical protein
VAHFPRNVLGYIPGPTFCGVKGHDAQWAGVLSNGDPGDDAALVGLVIIGFYVSAAAWAKVIENDVNRLIKSKVVRDQRGSARHDTHSTTLPSQCGSSIAVPERYF